MRHIQNSKQQISGNNSDVVTEKEDNDPRNHQLAKDRKDLSLFNNELMPSKEKIDHVQE